MRKAFARGLIAALILALFVVEESVASPITILGSSDWDFFVDDVSVLSLGSVYTVDFDAEAAGRGELFTGHVDSPLTIGIITFAAGELLNHATFLPADDTGIYGTSQHAPGVVQCDMCTNPLLMSFSQPVNSITLTLFNGWPGPVTYTIFNDIGESESFKLASNLEGGFATVTLNSPDFNSVGIRAETPEPASIVLLGSGLIVVVRRRRFVRRLLP